MSSERSAMSSSSGYSDNSLIIVYGDSNTYGYNPATGGQYPNGGWVKVLRERAGLHLLNLGELGRSVPVGPTYSIREIETMTGDGENTFLWIMLGDNDLLEGCSAVDAGIRMKRFITSALGVFSNDHITLIAPPVLKSGTWVSSSAVLAESEKLQGVYKNLAVELDIDFIFTADWNIPLAYDGVHFTEEGHVIFAKKTAAALNDPLQKNKN